MTMRTTLIALALVLGVGASASAQTVRSGIGQSAPVAPPQPTQTYERRLQLASYALMGSQMADGITTAAAIYSGTGREVNPVARLAVNNPLAFTAFKFGGAVAIDYLVIKYLGKRHPKVALVTAYVIAGFYTGVAINNARIVREGRMR